MRKYNSFGSDNGFTKWTYRYIARMWFKNNHPLVQQWERDGVKWHMHHWDKHLKKNNPERYHMWMIEDLVPMIASAHVKIHNRGEQHHRYGKHHTDETKRKMSESGKGKHSHVTSEETKRKISESLRKVIHTEEWNRKMGAAHSTKVICVETGQVFSSFVEAKRWVGAGDISYAVRKNKTAGGYHWKYYCEEEQST